MLLYTKIIHRICLSIFPGTNIAKKTNKFREMDQPGRAHDCGRESLKVANFA